MFKFHLCIFNLVIEINIFRNKKNGKTKLSVDFDEEGEKVAEGHDRTPKNISNKPAETNFSDVNKEQVENPEEVFPEMSEESSEISLRANLFAEELAKRKVDENGLYDIPEDSEIPSYRFSPDVEIITDDYEKEVEDKIEGRG